MLQVGVDIDDTLCHFTLPLNDYIRTTYGIERSIVDYTTTDYSKVWSCTPAEAQNIIREFVYTDRSVNLSPIDGALDTLLALKNTGWYTFHAISARDSALYDETVAWLDKHYPGIFTSVSLCNYYGNGERKTKSQVCIDLRISIMIDDRPDVYDVELTTNRSVRVLTYGQPWNTRFGDHTAPASSISVTWPNLLSLLIKDPVRDMLSRPSKKVTIGMSGKIGSGKDTAFEIASEYFPALSHASFAKRLKEVVSVLTGCEIALFYSREGKSYIPPGFSHTIGTLLQKTGVSLRNSISEDVWCDIVLKGTNASTHTMVTDCRFENEVRAILEVGGLVIRVNGDPARIRERNDDGRDLHHVSETALDNYPFEHVIENDSTLDEYESNVMQIVIPYMYGRIEW